MVEINTLFKKKRISLISDADMKRYLNFFDNSYKENLRLSEKIMADFPRWSIISGYYALHDVTKLFIAKKSNIKIDLKVHQTTIQVLKLIVKDRNISKMIETGYSEFKRLANDLEEAKKERIKAQYYTGTNYLTQEYFKRALQFHEKIVIPYINKIRGLLA